MPPGQGQTIDYAALADQARAHAPIDYAAMADQARATQGTPESAGSAWNTVDPKVLQQQIESNPFRILQIPFEQLGATANRSHDILADKMLQDAAKGRGVSKTDYVKSFLLGSGADAARMTAGATSPEGIGVATATALAPEVMAPILLAHGGINAAENIPDAIKGDPDAVQRFLQSASEATGGAAVGKGAIGKGTTSPIRDIWTNRVSQNVEQALGRQLTPAEATTPRPAGTNLPALNNTPQEVLTYAKSKGIDMTPGQATEDALAQNLQKTGRTAAIGGKDLSNALIEQYGKFSQAVNDFKNRLDPPKTSAQVGQSLQNTVKTAESVAHDNASNAYSQINDFMESKVDPSQINKTWKTVSKDFPVGAEDQILAQTPRSMRAVVEDMLSAKPEGFQPTVQEAIQLRKFFRDLGQTEGLPNREQALYSKLENAASSTLDAAAKAGRWDPQWEQANQGWKDYKTKYGDPDSILYRLTRTRTPEQAVTMLQNAQPSELAQVKNEIAVKNAQGQTTSDFLGPLRRSVVKDIQLSRFRIGADDGLGGYSHEYLSQLFSPQDLKELYVQSDLAGRLHYDPNPSGTASGISAMDELKFWNQAKSSAAAKMSMPRDPTSFLPGGARPPASIPIGPAYRSLTPKYVSLRALAGGTGSSQSAEEGR